MVSKSSEKLPEKNTRLWVEAGKYDRYRGGASTQGELNSVRYLFNVSSWNLSAYRDEGRLFTGREFEAGQERQQASAKFIFHPGEVSSLSVRGFYLNNHEATPGELFKSDFKKNDKGIF